MRIVKIVLIVSVLAFGAWYSGLIQIRHAKAAGIGLIIEKIEVYVEQQGFTWQQIKSATRTQWYSHAVTAGLTTAEMKQFVGGKSVIRSAIIKRKKRANLVAEANALLVHIRKAGPDVETIPLMREIFENWEEYGVDPNAFN